MSDEAPTPPPPSITLRFADRGAADCTIALDRVTPGQVMAAAWFLDAYARELRAQSVAAAPANVRAMPTPAELAKLRAQG